MVIPPQAVAAGDFDPDPEGEERGGAGVQRPQANVELGLRVDVVLVEFFFPRDDHLHILGQGHSPAKRKGPQEAFTEAFKI